MKRARSLSFVGFFVSAVILAACSGDDGAKGEPGAPGLGGEPSVSGITPGRAYLARKVDVTLSGNGTKWAEGTTVDFGAGIKVDKLVVASPTALVASLTVTDAATVGPRDVTVTAGEVVSTYKGAFTVESPLALTIKGTAAQGSVFFVSAQSKDLSTPFDTTAESSLFSAPVFKGIELKEIPGVLVQVSDVSLYKVEMAVIVDVTTAAGTKALSLLSGVEGTEKVPFPYPQGLDVAARTAAPLTLGTASSQTVDKGFDSKLFTFSPTAGLGLVDVVVTSKDPDFDPTAIILGKSGKFDDRLTGFARASTLLSTNADPLYVIVADTSGAKGSYTITAKSQTATAATEAADNDTSGTAQALATLPAIVTNGSLSSGTDADWYAVTATAGDVGKKLRVLTAPGDAQADTVVSVFGSDGTTAIGEATDDNYHETFLSPAITAAGVYYVKISFSSQSTWASAGSKYQLAVRFE